MNKSVRMGCNLWNYCL